MLTNRRVWLGLLAAWVCLYHGTVTYTVIDYLHNGLSKPASPVNLTFGSGLVSGMTADAFEMGVRDGDQLVSVDGMPFTAMRVLFEAVNRRKPGDLLPVVVRSAKGTVFDVKIRIPAQASEPTTVFEWVGQVALVIGVPMFCLSLGFWVCFQRPNDRSAWLALGMMMGLAGLAQEFLIAEQPGQLLMVVWWALFASPFGLWTSWTILFALLFPSPTRLDSRLSWLKWIGVAPLLLLTVSLSLFEVGREFSFRLISFLRPLIYVALVTRVDLLLPFATLVCFLILIGLKTVLKGPADGKRRLRILLLGSSLSFAPVLMQSLRAIRVGSDLLSWAGPLEYFLTLLPILLFPIVLAYVMMIRRAMDVRTTVRQGIQTGLSARGSHILQLMLTAAVIGAVALIPATSARLAIAGAGFLLIAVVRPATKLLAPWIDRRLFPQIVENEAVLKQLAISLRSLMEETTLVHTLTKTISIALQVQRIAFLRNCGGELTVAFRIGNSDEPEICLQESSGIVRHLKLAQRAARIYFDERNNWIHTVNPLEQLLLKQDRTEVVVPVAVKNEFLGALLLGARMRDAPYTRRDLELLDEVARQAGIALENARLARTVAVV